MPTDQKVTGLSPVGVTLKITRLQRCKRVICFLFSVRFPHVGRQPDPPVREQDGPGAPGGGYFSESPVEGLCQASNYAQAGGKTRSPERPCAKGSKCG